MTGRTKKKGLPLSITQKKAWGFLLGYITDNGYAPTRREIGLALGYPEASAVQSANDLLLHMEEKGYIKLDRHKHRGIQLVQG